MKSLIKRTPSVFTFDKLQPLLYIAFFYKNFILLTKPFPK